MSETTKKKRNTRKKTVAKKVTNKKAASKKTTSKAMPKKKVAKKTTTKAAPKKAARKRKTAKLNLNDNPLNTYATSGSKKPVKFEDVNDSKYEKARFDIRFSKSQKDFFEYAANLGGFKTLTSFIIHSLELKSKIIIEDYNKILDSERDREIFFNALLNPEMPNKNLINATKEYIKLTAKK